MKARTFFPGLLVLGTSLVRGELGPQYRGLVAEGMGLSGTASPRGAHSLFVNPAGLHGGPPLRLEFSGYLGLNAVLLDYASWAGDNYRHLDNMDSLLARIGPVDNKWAPFANAFNLTAHFGDYALALVEDIRYSVTVGKAVITPVPGVGMLSDFILSFGRGFIDEKHGLRLGLAAKYLYRVRFDRRLVGTTDEEFYLVKREWERPGNGLLDHFQKLGVASKVAATHQGVGLNAGLTKSFDNYLTVGAAFLDFPTVLDRDWVMPDINLGISYHPSFRFAEWNHRLSLNGDLHHLLAPDVPWYKQIKLGAGWEVSAGKRPMGNVGIGLNDGYPAFGIRLGYIVYLSYTYFAEEAGGQPGQDRLSFHKLNLELGI